MRKKQRRRIRERDGYGTNRLFNRDLQKKRQVRCPVERLKGDNRRESRFEQDSLRPRGFAAVKRKDNFEMEPPKRGVTLTNQFF